MTCRLGARSIDRILHDGRVVAGLATLVIDGTKRRLGMRHGMAASYRLTRKVEGLCRDTRGNNRHHEYHRT
jgi:hypothetical protein